MSVTTIYTALRSLSIKWQRHVSTNNHSINQATYNFNFFLNLLFLFDSKAWLVPGLPWLCDTEFFGLRFLVWIPSFFILIGLFTWKKRHRFITETLWMKIILKNVTDTVSYIYQRFFFLLLLQTISKMIMHLRIPTPDKLMFWNNWDMVYHRNIFNL